MTADVQRELAEKLVEVFVNVLIASRQSAVADLGVTPRQWAEEGARQLRPLIADAEKRAAARAAAYAYEQGYDACRHGEQRRNPYRARADALDPT